MIVFPTLGASTDDKLRRAVSETGVAGSKEAHTSRAVGGCGEQPAAREIRLGVLASGDVVRTRSRRRRSRRGIDDERAADRNTKVTTSDLPLAIEGR